VSRRAHLIVNPSSGRELAPEFASTIAARLRQRYDAVEMTVTAGDGDAHGAAAAAAEAGCDAIFVAGGDGTVNEAVNGVAAARALRSVHLGIVPLGTGNDFAAALDIPFDVEQALDVLLRERLLAVDLGRLNGRLFVNTSGGGFIADVSVAVTPQLKTVAGRLAYLIGGAQALLDYDPVRATVRAEPGRIRIGAALYAFAICNSRLIGGGRLIAPAAVIDDGLLDLCLIESMRTVEFVALVRKVADGEHVHDPRVRYVQASEITIEFDREVNVNTDGEVFTAARCEYSVLPRAAMFLAGERPFAVGDQESVFKGTG
jgi:diacylglycerol kinase (ATP)